MQFSLETPQWWKRPSWREFNRPYFAWHPVKLEDGDWAWFETVMRRYDWYKVAWQYRTLYEQTEKPPTRWQCYMIDIFGRRTLFKRSERC